MYCQQDSNVLSLVRTPNEHDFIANCLKKSFKSISNCNYFLTSPTLRGVLFSRGKIKLLFFAYSVAYLFIPLKKICTAFLAKNWNIPKIEKSTRRILSKNTKKKFLKEYWKLRYERNFEWRQFEKIFEQRYWENTLFLLLFLL